MVSYSFKRRFVIPIQVGLGQIERIEGTEYQPKRQTIRAERKRHARPGEEVQLYFGMRTKQCFLIGRARCISIRTIRLVFNAIYPRVFIDFCPVADELDKFAKADGFDNWVQLHQFWREEHPAVENFEGVLIQWEPLA